MTEKNDKSKIIAGIITFIVAVLILLFLFFGGMSFDREQLAVQSTPEISPDEELFLEPELLTDFGEENVIEEDAPTPAFKGEPEPAETDNLKQVVPDKNPKPAPPVEKPITQKKESTVKATTPSVSDEEKQKVTSSIAKGFSGKNGNTEGNTGTSGAGGEGTLGIKGNANGRTFKGCPSPKVELRHKTTVTVTVVINAEGNVTSATATGGASASIRKACEQAARNAKWSEKKGTGETRGTITFTITPK